jgi:hypothetical protein
MLGTRILYWRLEWPGNRWAHGIMFVAGTLYVRRTFITYIPAQHFWPKLKWVSSVANIVQKKMLPFYIIFWNYFYIDSILLTIEQVGISNWLYWSLQLVAAGNLYNSVFYKFHNLLPNTPSFITLLQTSVAIAYYRLLRSKLDFYSVSGVYPSQLPFLTYSVWPA